MYIIDEFHNPPGVRYRYGRSRSANTRGATRTRSSRSSAGEQEGINPPAELYAQASGSLASWGYVYQINTQNIATGSNVSFSNNGPLNGINHEPDTPTIEVTLPGTYNITFSVYTTQNNPQDWGVVVNGTERSRFNAAGQSITGTTSLVLEAMDRVTIRNVNTIPSPATLRVGDFTTAYVLIYKVDS